MPIATTSLSIQTTFPGLYEFTEDVRGIVSGTGTVAGMVNLFCRHTSASLVIQENADPDVMADLQAFFEHIVPRDFDFRHITEGSDDMPAHIKSALTASNLCIPILDGRLGLGNWQGIYLFEHRDRPHSREVILQIISEQ